MNRLTSILAIITEHTSGPAAGVAAVPDVTALQQNSPGRAAGPGRTPILLARAR